MNKKEKNLWLCEKYCSFSHKRNIKDSKTSSLTRCKKYKKGKDGFCLSYKMIEPEKVF